jgi:hypothetical protein
LKRGQSFPPALEEGVNIFDVEPRAGVEEDASSIQPFLFIAEADERSLRGYLDAEFVGYLGLVEKYIRHFEGSD